MTDETVQEVAPVEQDVKITHEQLGQVVSQALTRLASLELAWAQVAPMLTTLREAVYNNDKEKITGDVTVEQFIVDASVWLRSFINEGVDFSGEDYAQE